MKQYMAYKASDKSLKAVFKEPNSEGLYGKAMTQLNE